MENNSSQSNAVGIVSFILGLLGIVWAFFLPGGCFITVILGIIALVLWHRSFKLCGHNAMASLGHVFGIISIILFVVVLVIMIVVGVDSGIFSSIISM